MIISAPSSETAIPITRFGPIFSPKNRKAPRVINTGLILNKAVASAKPNLDIAKKNSVVAIIKAIDLDNWSLGYFVLAYTFIRGNIKIVTSTACTV